MENLKNRCAVDLVTSEEKLKKATAQCSFKQFKIFHENLVVVKRAKVELTLNQANYVGFTVLDLSETLMYNFHYNYSKRKYPYSTLLFANTDSLTYQIQQIKCTKNFMLISICSIFLSTRNKIHYIMIKKKNVIIKMKDELNEEIIKEFVGLMVKT